MKDVYNIFRNTIRANGLVGNGEKVLAAVSGGADSVFMLLLLKKYLPVGALGAAHFNHMIRGQEADRDEAFVKELCAGIGVPFFAGSADIPFLAGKEGTGIEECARKYRYAFLEDVSSKNGFDRIAVAHNLSDNAETILMHLLRGGALDGLSGIPYKRGRIIRPVLDISRDEIEEYLSEHKTGFVSDSTNADTGYLRNRIRLEIIPFLKEKIGYDPSPVLVRQARVAADEKDYLEKKTADFCDSFMKKTGGNVVLDAEALMKEHPAVARRAVRTALCSVENGSGEPVFKGRKDADSASAERVIDMIRNGKKGSSADCGKGVTARLTHSGAVFSYCPEPHPGADQPPSFKVRTFRRNGQPGAPGETLFRAGRDRAFFDKRKYSDIIAGSGREEAVWRHCLPGDVIVPFGMSGTKKVRKLFIDERVPSEERDGIFVLSAGNEILWIPGICTSELTRIDEQTDEIIEISIIKEGTAE